MGVITYLHWDFKVIHASKEIPSWQMNCSSPCFKRNLDVFGSKVNEIHMYFSGVAICLQIYTCVLIESLKPK